MRRSAKNQTGYFTASVLALVIIGLVYLICFIAYSWYHSGKTRAIAGLREPIQSSVKCDMIHFERKGYRFDMKYCCSYDIDALVVHTKDYPSTDNMSDVLSPVDLGLAWGKVAELNDSIDFNWDQVNRHCSCEVTSDLDIRKIGGIDNLIRSFSNNHIIPAEKNVEKDLKKIRRGDHVRLRGYLVDIVGVREKDGQEGAWNSSLTREDEGDHACEVFYVTNIDWIDD